MLAGGAIASISSNVTIKESRPFEGNCAEAGEAILSELHSNITIINTTFKGINAIHDSCQSFGGVLYTDSGCNMAIHDSQFTNNKAYKGGVVYAKGDVNIIIIHSYFVNSAVGGNYGGAVYAERNVKVVITDSQFINSSALGTNYFGGLVKAQGYVNITIAHSQFINNNVSFGAVLNLDYGAIATITHSQFTNNSALVLQTLALPDCYGVVCASDADIDITNSEFVNNSVRGSGGGGVVFTNGTVKVTITHSQFVNNSALTDGSRIRYAFIDKTSVINNVGGGVVYAENRLTYSLFINNTAQFNGGVLWLHRVGEVIVISHTTELVMENLYI